MIQSELRETGKINWKWIIIVVETVAVSSVGPEWNLSHGQLILIQFVYKEKEHLTSTRIPPSINCNMVFIWIHVAVAYYIQWDQLKRGNRTFRTFHVDEQFKGHLEEKFPNRCFLPLLKLSKVMGRPIWQHFLQHTICWCFLSILRAKSPIRINTAYRDITTTKTSQLSANSVEKFAENKSHKL